MNSYAIASLFLVILLSYMDTALLNPKGGAMNLIHNKSVQVKTLVIAACVSLAVCTDSHGSIPMKRFGYGFLQSFALSSDGKFIATATLENSPL
jgi:hypothetical protein